MTTTKTLLKQGSNGNTNISLYSDGSRVVDYQGNNPDTIILDYPMNVDIRLSTKCRFGRNPNTGKALCGFCHESATTDGKAGNYTKLIEHIRYLPKTTEIAIGINDTTDNELFNMLSILKEEGYVVNGTINQGLVRLGLHKKLYNANLLYGIGISYRSMKWGFDDPIYKDPNTVLHVIAGIDSFDDIEEIVKKNYCSKILILGEKDFGFNKDNVKLDSDSHKQWYRNINKLFKYATVSFDNLAIEQLNIKRFFMTDRWNILYQGERSMYINAVEETFSPSSRSDDKTDWSVGIKNYWDIIK
jgi:hypothetical protein